MGRTRRTDFRELTAKRNFALERTELREHRARPTDDDRALVDRAIAEGRVQKFPASKRKPR
jgi:hypothetical protein